jgi:hypothetical protein
VTCVFPRDADSALSLSCAVLVCLSKLFREQQSEPSISLSQGTAKSGTRATPDTTTQNDDRGLVGLNHDKTNKNDHEQPSTETSVYRVLQYRAQMLTARHFVVPKYCHWRAALTLAETSLRFHQRKFPSVGKEKFATSACPVMYSTCTSTRVNRYKYE